MCEYASYYVFQAPKVANEGESVTINSYAEHPPHQISTGQTEDEEEEETKLNDSHRAIPFVGGERCCDIEQPCRATFDLE